MRVSESETRGRHGADDALIAALAAGATVADAAKKADISPATAYRRLSEPAFKQRVTEARAAMFDRALGQLADASGQAAETLRGLFSARSEMVRLLAARAVIELGVRLHESAELERRIAEMEARLEGGTPSA